VESNSRGLRPVNGDFAHQRLGHRGHRSGRLLAAPFVEQLLAVGGPPGLHRLESGCLRQRRGCTSTPRWLRAAAEARAFDQDQLQRWVVEGEVGIARAALGRLGREELGLEGNGGVDVIAVEGELHAGHESSKRLGPRIGSHRDVLSVRDSPSTVVDD
jgi:hypothetical protein